MNIQEGLEEARRDGCDIFLIESVSAGSPIDTTGEDGETAVRSGSVWLVQAILERGIRVDVKNTDGCTALHVAPSGPDEAIVALLLDHGASGVNTKASGGDTPFHGAAAVNNKEIAKMLLDKGAETLTVKITKEALLFTRLLATLPLTQSPSSCIEVLRDQRPKF